MKQIDGWIYMESHEEKFINRKLRTIRYILISGFIASMIIFAISSTVSAADYYVSTSGNNNNPGTLESPWRNIGYAADTISPGDTAWIMSGTYVKDYINRPSSGTATAYKSIRKYSGTVLIDGKGDHATAIRLSYRSYWNIEGIDVTNIYKATYLNKQTSHHINFKDCEWWHIDQGIQMNRGVHDIVFDNIRIHDIYSGDNSVNIFGGSDDPSLVTKNIVIKNCEIYDEPKHNGINFGPMTGGGDSSWHNEYVIDGVLIENTKVHGVKQQAIYCNHVYVKNLTISNCTVYDSSKGIRVTVRDSKIINNEVYGIRDGNPIALQFENGKNSNVFEK